MDTIIFIVLLVTAIFASKGSPPKVVVPLFFVGFVMTAFVFHHHVTSKPVSYTHLTLPTISSV